MSSYLGVVMAGHVVPGKIDPRIRKSFITNTPLGPPAKVQRIEDLPKAPQPLGDDKNPDFHKMIKKMVQGEMTKPIQEVVPAMRDLWR